MMGSIQNICTVCGWKGQKHYAHNDQQHTNCYEERKEHKAKCNGLGGRVMDDIEKLAGIEEKLKELEAKQMIGKLFLYLSERHMMVCTRNGPAVMPDVLTLHIDRFLADRGES